MGSLAYNEVSIANYDLTLAEVYTMATRYSVTAEKTLNLIKLAGTYTAVPGALGVPGLPSWVADLSQLSPSVVQCIQQSNLRKFASTDMYFRQWEWHGAEEHFRRQGHRSTCRELQPKQIPYFRRATGRPCMRGKGVPPPPLRELHPHTIPAKPPCNQHFQSSPQSRKPGRGSSALRTL